MAAEPADDAADCQDYTGTRAERPPKSIRFPNRTVDMRPGGTGEDVAPHSVLAAVPRPSTSTR
jgi:hypothetical protein